MNPQACAQGSDPTVLMFAVALLVLASVAVSVGLLVNGMAWLFVLGTALALVAGVGVLIADRNGTI